MKPETILELVHELVGPVEPVADSAVDLKRQENLETLIYITSRLHHTVKQIAIKHYSSPYASAKRLGLMAQECMEDLNIHE